MRLREVGGHSASDGGQLSLSLFGRDAVGQAPEDPHSSLDLPVIVLGQYGEPKREPHVLSNREVEVLRHHADHIVRDAPDPDGLAPKDA